MNRNLVTWTAEGASANEEKESKSGQNSDDEDSYLEPSTPLTEEEKLVGCRSWPNMMFDNIFANCKY